jgi:serine/threonine protein kinase/Flp pilus assembly protein TadD
MDMLDDWPSRIVGAEAQSHDVDPLVTSFEAAGSSTETQEFHARFAPGDLAGLDSWRTTMAKGSFPLGGGWERGFKESLPQASSRLSKAAADIPRVGEDFLGFRLVEELGRGAFGRVFLALQGNLADRPMVLKIAPDLDGETKNLAQLQHTHIVPIYSVHMASPLQAFCMPYYGATTLGHVLSDVINRESLPESGRGLLSSLAERSRSRRPGPSSVAGETSDSSSAISLQVPAATDDGQDNPGLGSSQLAQTTLRMFEGMSYVHSILWIISCLADGLAHAHDRGILHRDLKPANILLTDEGQPMLLDFNLSENIRSASAVASTTVGGTIPYMAPEHLEALQGGKRPVDALSDIYSLGVILHELLTGRSPFPRPKGGASLDVMIRERSRLPEDPRRWNRSISPAVASIVLHCLEPEPCRRYQAAAELREDLLLQLGNLPLKHAPDPSIRERVQKWSRRHPRLLSMSTVGAVGLSVSLTLAIWIGLRVRGERLVAEARSTWNLFNRDLEAGRLVLNTSGVDTAKRQEGMEACQRALDRYSARADHSWTDARAFRHLDASDRARLPEEIGEALWLLARATWLGANDGLNTARVDSEVKEALRLNGLSEACFPEDRVPAALMAQRAELVGWLGRPDEAALWVKRAASTPSRTARDFYLEATEHAVRGRFAEAIPLLEEATRLDPTLYWAWFLRGACHDRNGQDVDALASYQACVALRPGESWPYFNRGLVRLRRKEFRQAGADFGEFIKREPQRYEAHLDRSLAWHGLGRTADSLRDIDAALALGAPQARGLFMRARVLRDAGDTEGSRRDLAAGMKHTPTDEPSWIARGLARADTETEAALADFRRALELNPRSLAALQNTAYVLADLPGRTVEAIAALTEALSLFPDYVPARSGRGVLLARIGRREEAIKDAEESLRRDSSPSTIYQVAGIYAQTSRTVPDDRLRAVQLLATALRSGFGWDLMLADPDLDPIRDHADLKGLTHAARTIEASPSTSANPR